MVVRCNAAQYDRRGLEDAGIVVVDLAYEDAAAPPVHIVAKFLAVAEAVPGAVGVPGPTGRGRAGTLIALYMMKHHGFTAREAMGWLRIMRPGSVIGEQQHYLCAVEVAMLGDGDVTLAGGLGSRSQSTGSGSAAAAELAAQVAAGMARRSSSSAASLALVGRDSSSGGGPEPCSESDSSR